MTIANQTEGDHIPFVSFHSQKLHKLFNERWPERAIELEKALKLSIAHGGLEEFGFKRIDGSSYNPRAARIPLLAYDIGKISNFNSLIAAVLFATNLSEEKCSKYLEQVSKCFSQEIFEILKSCQALEKRIQEEDSIDPKNLQPTAVTLNLCSFLDRLRHAHMSNEKEMKNCLDVYPKLINLIPENFQRMELLLTSWHKRTLINGRSSK